MVSQCRGMLSQWVERVFSSEHTFIKISVGGEGMEVGWGKGIIVQMYILRVSNKNIDMKRRHNDRS